MEARSVPESAGSCGPAIQPVLRARVFGHFFRNCQQTGLTIDLDDVCRIDRVEHLTRPRPKASNAISHVSLFLDFVEHLYPLVGMLPNSDFMDRAPE